nr:uncharacterized protein LOC122321449 [Drosophila bipectinata]
MVNLRISEAGKPKRHGLKNVYGVANLNLPMQSLSRIYGWLWMDDHLQQPPHLDGWYKEFFEQPVAAGGVLLAPSVTDGGYARALSILEETTKRVGRRYETGLLWRDDEVRLTEICNVALNRLVNIEEMRRDVDFARAYKGIMDDHVKKGYARRLEPQEAQRFQEGKLWYLPHFGVENTNKHGKVRLVFDAAAKVNGVSLNSALMKGPQRYKPLPAVLFHFREGVVGVCADIKEMFHQVLMQPQDRCAQRFLWRIGEDQREQDTLNASQYSSTDPRAALAIKEYVDDYVESHFDTAEEKVLGMYWQPAKDDFKIGVKYYRVPRSVMTGEHGPTKREFLSLVMSTFDPIGFLSCYMVTAKLLMREIWQRGVNWDKPLPDNLDASFEDWRQGMSKIEEFRCPRYYFGGGRVRMLQLHIFVDYSQSAFAAATYWWATYENGDVRAHFISSKTKCAPMRTMSIPRLELQAAVLGTRLMDTVKQEHGVAFSNCVLWTDSKTVLHWISSTHRRYKQFVGNRVAEILESTEASQWRWIPSAENVADDATRPLKAVDLSIDSRWLSGPPFLQGPEESWPRSSEGWIPPTMDEEEMKSHVGADHTVSQGSVGGDDRAASPQKDVPPKHGGNHRSDPAEVLDPELTEAATEGGEQVKRLQIAKSTNQLSPRWDLCQLVFGIVDGWTSHGEEMADDLSTDSYIIAIRNFMSRREPVVRVRSDNGKNFVGADREAKRFSEVFEPVRIQGELSTKGVE